MILFDLLMGLRLDRPAAVLLLLRGGMLITVGIVDDGARRAPVAAEADGSNALCCSESEARGDMVPSFSLSVLSAPSSLPPPTGAYAAERLMPVLKDLLLAEQHEKYIRKSRLHVTLATPRSRCHRKAGSPAS